MQFPAQEKPPVGLVFDSDMGAAIDTALALAMLYGFDGKGEARVASVSVTKSSLQAAAFCEVVGRFYGSIGGFGKVLPVGLSIGGRKPEDTPMLSVPLARRNPEGKPVYENAIHKLNDTAEVPALIRNALTAQYDQNCIVVLAAPATDLAGLLAIPGAKDLIQQKVRFLSFAGGAFPDGPPEPHIQADIAAARKLLAEWPTPIVASGHEVGEAVLYPGSSIETDFAWSLAHPISDAYRAYKPMPYDTATPDMTAVLYAVRPQGAYFKLSPPGTIRVLDDGRTTFIPSAGGKHRYLISDPSQSERIVRTYVEMASAKPVPRQPGVRKKAVQKP